MSKEINVSIKKAIEYVIKVYDQSRLILNDLEKNIIKNYNEISVLSNTNGSNTSKEFGSVYYWFPQYISRWYGKIKNGTKELEENTIIGTGVTFIRQDKVLEPILLCGIFIPRDISTCPKRYQYDYWWLNAAWFADGPDKKELEMLYEFNNKNDDISYSWYKKAKIYGKELTSISSPEDIEILFGKLKEFTSGILI